MTENAIVRSGVSGIELFNTAMIRIRGTGSVPEVGVKVLHLDTSQCSSADRSDASALAAGLVVDRPDATRELWILDVVHGHFTPRELPVRIVDFLTKHQGYQRATIEKIVGSGFLSELIRNEWERRGVLKPPKLIWTPMQNQASKAHRISRLARLSRENRLWLVAGNWNDTWTQQAERFTGELRNRGRGDDALDAVAGCAANVFGL
jgi:hypothetical protein